MATGQSSRGKRTTVADMIAAAKVGAIDINSEVVTVEAAEQAARETAATVAALVRPEPRSGTEHECAIPGCRHGAAHGPTQPDRQVKLACPKCGAVARMTQRALAVSGGIKCANDDVPFVTATRRTYSRKVA